MRSWAWVLLMAALGAAAAGAEDKDEKLWRHRNLGKAFYENPATQYEAVGEFKKALELAPDSARERINYGLSLMRAGKVDEGIAELEKAQKQDPSIPHTWFNLGIAYKNASRYADAIVQLEKMVELVPDEAISHYNLGVLYKLEGQNEKALHHFERAAELDPNLAGPHFQLATAYRQAKRAEEAKKAMATFREIKQRTAGAAVPEDLEWSFYSEIYETIDPEKAAEAGPPAEWKFEAEELATGLDAETAGLATLDADGDGRPDLLAWSKAGARLFSGGEKTLTSGLENLQGIRALRPGDANGDPNFDLVAVTDTGASVWIGQGDGQFEKSADLPNGSYRDAIWLDYDHDYDLDLVLLGADQKLLRNEGENGWGDESASFPFASGRALTGARFDLVADTQGIDLAVAYADRGGVLYRDLLGGKYEARELPALPRGARAVAAYDFNNDGWTDLAAATASGTALLINDQDEGFEKKTAPAAQTFVFADLENRGVAELAGSTAIHRNRGLGRFAEGKKPAGYPEAMALAAADFDADGQIDLATVSKNGTVALLKNTTQTDNRWLRVGIQGVKNPALAPGAEIEVKAGTRYQKKLYEGVPLVFGLDDYAQVDAVRITWPNGLIQNESKQPAGQAVSYEEAQRLSGSCPMIFTWNGDEFQFITDVLGVAPLGASAGDGEYFPVDHDEVVQIPRGALVPNAEGLLEIRVTEELREISYLDQIHLLAADHPSEIELFTNDKFKGPPFPEFKLFGVAERHAPTAARDHHGRNVLDRVLERDQTYPDSFERDYAGVAELHHLELDFGDVSAEDGAADNAVLVLSGWVDWADGSTFLGAAQESDTGLVMPHLQVKNDQGEWQTVIEDMGIPAGKPKTIVVELEGVFIGASRELRIVTNLCVYWDEIFLAENAHAPEVRLHELPPESAELGFRGFSRVVIHPERKEPEYFVYADVKPTSMWNPTRGLYTRFGDVRPLLTRIDDRFVIMGAGDELQLLFDPHGLPPLPKGWERSWLLFVDGWAKDGDANTAHSQTVGPLPYHGMPQYPYEPPHGYPEDENKLYLEHYNTRPALRLIRPLTEDLGERQKSSRR